MGDCGVLYMNENIDKFIDQDFKSLSKWLFTLDPYEFTLVSTIIGFIISPSLTINEQNSLGNFFELLGQIILTINAQATTLNSKKNVNIYNEIEELKNEIRNLKDKLL